MGSIRHLVLAQENLVKYKLQYQSPLWGETVELPTSPISTDIGIYKAMEDVEDVDFHMRYIYENVLHHQDQVKSLESSRSSEISGVIKRWLSVELYTGITQPFPKNVPS